MTGLYETALYALSVGLQTTLFLTLGAALSRRVKSPARAYFLLVCLVVAATLLPFLTALVTTKFSFWQFTPRSADGPSVATRGAFYIALGVLTVGALRQAILLLGGMAQSRRLMFSARPLASPDLHGRLEKCLTLFQGKSFPVLFTSKRISHPSIWCWGLHPAILLPEELLYSATSGSGKRPVEGDRNNGCSDTLPEELLYSATSGSGKRPVEGDRNNGCSDTLPEVIFLHELAHLIRRDHISGLLTRLGAVVLFWNPLYWQILRRLETLSDEACDLFVLSRSEISAKFYSETLLRMASDEKSRPVYQFFAQKETIMKRITTIFDFSSGKLTGAESLPGRAWGASVVVGTLAVCLAMSLGLTFRVTAGEEGGDASVQAESPEAKQARIQKERSPRSAVERFDAERAKERAELIGRGVTDAELDAAEKKVREAQAGFDTGQVGIAELSEAKRKLAERRLVQSGDQKYADEIVTCYKNALDMVQAQFDTGHPNGTSWNLAEAKVKYYNAKMTFAPFGSPVNFEDAEKILAAAVDLVRSAQCEFDNGKMSLADLTEVNARAEKIRATYQPILAERTAN